MIENERFELTNSDIKDFRIYDYAKEDAYFIDCDEHTGKGLVDLLNSLSEENKQLKQQLKDCTAKAKREIRKKKEENAIRWANIGR